jgi:hypothetical protein
MKQRSFVKRNGKIEIKEEVEQEDIIPLGSKQDLIFRADKFGFIERGRCAFIREYIPGEFDGHDLPKDLDLSEITHTFVIIAMDTGMRKGDGEEHVIAHLMPLGETYKAVIFDMKGNRSMNARVPLLPEQAEIIRLDMEKGER